MLLVAVCCVLLVVSGVPLFASCLLLVVRGSISVAVGVLFVGC